MHKNFVLTRKKLVVRIHYRPLKNPDDLQAKLRGEGPEHTPGPSCGNRAATRSGGAISGCLRGRGRRSPAWWGAHGCRYLDSLRGDLALIFAPLLAGPGIPTKRSREALEGFWSA